MMKQEQEKREDLEITEVAELLGVTKRTVQRYIGTGELLPVYHSRGKRGRPYRKIDRMSVAKFVKKRMNKG